MRTLNPCRKEDKILSALGVSMLKTGYLLKPYPASAMPKIVLGTCTTKIKSQRTHQVITNNNLRLLKKQESSSVIMVGDVAGVGSNSHCLGGNGRYDIGYGWLM